MHDRIVVVVVAALVAGTSGRLSGPTQAPEAPTLAGKWQIDPTRSDRPGRMDRGGFGGGGRRPGGGGGRPGSFPGGGGRGPGGAGGMPGEGGSPAVMQFLRPSQQMEVALTDSTISILDGAGSRPGQRPTRSKRT